MQVFYSGCELSLILLKPGDGNQTSQNIVSGIPSVSNSWIQIRTNVLLGLIWVQTLCKKATDKELIIPICKNCEFKSHRYEFIQLLHRTTKCQVKMHTYLKKFPIKSTRYCPE